MASSQKVAEALAADVKRLMKERREPLTDADLKESLNETTLRLKRMQEQNKKLTELMGQKESQIELLKAQVERLKSNAA
jgi:predicted RNase H-like nuclease (RuvC/YqgF family)